MFFFLFLWAIVSLVGCHVGVIMAKIWRPCRPRSNGRSFTTQIRQQQLTQHIITLQSLQRSPGVCSQDLRESPHTGSRTGRWFNMDWRAQYYLGTFQLISSTGDRHSVPPLTVVRLESPPCWCLVGITQQSRCGPVKPFSSTGSNLPWGKRFSRVKEAGWYSWDAGEDLFIQKGHLRRSRNAERPIFHLSPFPWRCPTRNVVCLPFFSAEDVTVTRTVPSCTK